MTIFRNLFVGLLILSPYASSSFAQIVQDSASLQSLRATDISGKTPDQVHKANLDHYAAFVKMDPDTDKDWDKPKFLKKKYAEEVLYTASINPVVSLSAYGKYDPKNEGIGFCFGRAMFIHLELRHRGFDRDLIKKAFVVGPMQTPDGGSWGWHVTTIVQSKDSKGKETWLTIDPITGKSMDVLAWYNEMRDNYSTDKKLKLYITSAGRFGPGGYVYDEKLLKDEFYNRYFTDMNEWFDKESRTTDHYKVPFKEFDVR